MDIEIYENGEGFGYRILTDEGHVIAEQPFDADLEGFAPMTQERANASAALAVSAYLAPKEIQNKTAEQIRIETLEFQNSELNKTVIELWESIIPLIEGGAA